MSTIGLTITEAIRARLREEAGRDRDLGARFEHLCTLLENYQDVLDGIQDGTRSFVGPGDGLALMCEAWNSPAYQQLERLRIVLSSEEPALYWQIAEVYFRAGRRQVAACPRCGEQVSPKPESLPDRTLHYGFCQQKRCRPAKVRMSPLVVRVVSKAVEPAMVVLGVQWLEERWAGGVFVPEDVQAVVERRAPKQSRRRVVIV